ncbi:polysaccharide ABC transporter ATP-binding protein [Thermomonas carbonis]|uniref:ATP-binding cassette domain-containing protein n=1 Tax=Thermomonas carbonis TaxID=1463158 RepID=A0A7G9SMP7_9GAMM|nr:ATP-binding cassette domain-containing protein [Thermomonas carbonis]QNN69122.1 ATP-binding cassette domain-containing protein [Thermomonas carbonis]GHC06590.1 hypothetical protein GCM10010080_20940 [Thermomonas carbonis]
MTALGETLIRVDAVSKRFCRRGDRMLRYGMQDLVRDLVLAPPRDMLREGEFWGLRDINLTIRRGDVIGLVGHNGAGKSSFLKLLAGIYRPTLGSITINTAKVALLDHGAGLDPMQTGRESIFTKLALLGQEPAQIHERVDAIIALAELGHVIDAAVCTYSTGMRVRLAFAIYANVDVDIFIVDDSLGVADIRFAQRMQRYWQDFVAAGGTLLLASHEMYQMRSLCRRALLFDHGRIVGEGDTEAIIAEYLLRSAPPGATAEWQSEGQEPDVVPAFEVPSAETVLTELPTEGQSALAIERFARFSGSGAFPVRITAIETEAEPAVGPRAVQVQGQLKVRVHCESDIELERVLFGLEIFNAHKQVAIHVRGPDAAPYYRLMQGRNVFSATLVHVPLMPGQYSVCAALVDSESKAILGMRGWEEGGDPLTVLPSFGNDLLGAVSRSALMTAGVHWMIDSVANPGDVARNDEHSVISDALVQQG